MSKALWREFVIPIVVLAGSMTILVVGLAYAADWVVTETVENGGLRPALEQLWCGEVGCMEGEGE